MTDVDLVELRAGAGEFDDFLTRFSEHLPAIDGPFVELMRLALETAWAMGAESSREAALRDDSA